MPADDSLSASGDPAYPLRRGLLLWLAGGVLICAGLGVASVSRTQEARVLETAREMLGSDLHNWLVPRVNGHIRLQKPPLAYWLTAFSYKLLGVSEGVGRIPAALSGWLTVGVAASIASWLFGRRAGFFAGAALFGSYLFFRHSRLAETDVLATLFITSAVFALWRGFGRDDADRPTFGRAALWFHAAAAMIALAILSKGPPAGFPLLFFIGLAAFNRRWSALGQFVASGAPLTAAVIALPWFLYVRQDPMYGQLVGDLRNSAGGGRGHSGLFTTYLPPLFVATAPWSALWIAGLIGAFRHWRSDPRLRGMAIWVSSILLPMFLWGNKQFHYLMFVMPPLMALVGWLLDQSLKPDAGKEGLLVRRIWAVTAFLFGFAAPGLIVAGKMDRGYIQPADVVVTVLLAAMLAAVWLVFRARGVEAAMKTFAVGTAAAMFVVVGLWAPSLNPLNCRTIVPQLEARYGDGPFAFAGKEDLPLVFHMRRIVPVVRSESEVAELGTRRPRFVVIEPISGTNRPRPAIQEDARFEADETIYRIGFVRPTSATAPASAPTSPLDANPGE